MIVKPPEAAAFCQRPEPAVGLVLLYGPDQGLVAERRRQLLEAVLGAADDPFRLAELPMDRLQQAPGLLLEEAQAMSLIGGRRVVLVRQATDGLTKPLEALLAMAGHEALVIVEAGELGKSSPLRRLAEKSKVAAAIACYRAEGRGLEAELRGLVRAQGFGIEPDALAFLVSHVGADREITRGEVEKLALYLGAGTEGEGARATLADVEAVVGNSSALGIDRLVWAGLVGRPADATRALDRLLAEGQAPIRLIRAFAAMLLRLLPLRARVEAGEPPAAVLDSLRPPVHFSQKPAMQRALESWPLARLEAGLGLAYAAELAAKRAQSPDRLLLRRLLLDLRGAAGSEKATT
jgi:DNA polymerase-3 subunit delta